MNYLYHGRPVELLAESCGYVFVREVDHDFTWTERSEIFRSIAKTTPVEPQPGTVWRTKHGARGRVYRVQDGHVHYDFRTGRMDDKPYAASCSIAGFLEAYTPARVPVVGDRWKRDDRVVTVTGLPSGYVDFEWPGGTGTASLATFQLSSDWVDTPLPKVTPVTGTRWRRKDGKGDPVTVVTSTAGVSTSAGYHWDLDRFLRDWEPVTPLPPRDRNGFRIAEGSRWQQRSDGLSARVNRIRDDVVYWRWEDDETEFSDERYSFTQKFEEDS